MISNGKIKPELFFYFIFIGIIAAPCHCLEKVKESGRDPAFRISLITKTKINEAKRQKPFEVCTVTPTFLSHAPEDFPRDVFKPISDFYLFHENPVEITQAQSWKMSNPLHGPES